MAREQPKHERAQHVTLGWRVAAAVVQRAGRDPALEYAGGREELGKERELPVRRGHGLAVPARVHSTAQRVHYLRVWLAPVCSRDASHERLLREDESGTANVAGGCRQ